MLETGTAEREAHIAYDAISTFFLCYHSTLVFATIQVLQNLH